MGGGRRKGGCAGRLHGFRLLRLASLQQVFYRLPVFRGRGHREECFQVVPFGARGLIEDAGRLVRGRLVGTVDG